MRLLRPSELKIKISAGELPSPLDDDDVDADAGASFLLSRA